MIKEHSLQEILASYDAASPLQEASTIPGPWYADPRIALCVVTGHGEPHLTSLLIPSLSGVTWFEKATRAEIVKLLSDLCSEAPDYAVPRAYVVLALEEALKNQLISNGRPVRKQIGTFVQERAAA